MRAGIIISLAIWTVVYLSACSVKFEVGYHGETGRDDRTQTNVAAKK